MRKTIEKILKTINPYRRIIVSILLVGLFASTVLAFNQTTAGQKNTSQLNPRTSSISFEKVKIVKKHDSHNKNKKKNNSKTNQQPTKQEETVVKTVVNREPRENKDKENKAIEIDQNLSQAKLIIAAGSMSGSYQVDFNKDETISGLELMKSAKDNFGLIYNSSGSGAMTFINSIGNLETKITKEPGCKWSGKAWLLYQNGQQTMVGIGNILINNGDQLTWNYENYCY